MFKITNLSNVAMTKPPNIILPDGNHRKTVDDTHNETQDNQMRLKFSECSRPNEKEAIHLEQLLTDERKKSQPFLKSEPVLLQKRLKACREGFNHATYLA
jgi:hypothetical protein